MSTPARPRLLTLPDVAALAGVQRPVVSMWRRRTVVRGVQMLFPPAVTVSGRVEYFRADDVVAYLARTGRGCNPESAADAPTLAPPPGADHVSAETLLTLAVLTGAELAAADLTALAAEVDPRDHFLLDETRAARWPSGLPGYVDDLLGGSWGAEDAFARLDGGRLARQQGRRGCTPELVDLITRLTTAARDHAGADAALDPSGDSMLDHALAPLFGALVTGDRSLRRRAAAREWPVVGDGAATVRVRMFLDTNPAELLHLVDEVVLGLGEQDAAVVVGPAAILADRLTGRAERDRAATLRPGPLAAALRLPRGQWRGAHRRSLAVWLLVGSAGRTTVRLADLDGVHLDLDDLTTDVVQALDPMGSYRTEARSYRYLRPRPLAPVLAGGPLIPRGTRALALTDEDDTQARAQSAAQVLTQPLAVPSVQVAPGTGRHVISTVSLGELGADRKIALRPGRRVDPAGSDPDGSVLVLAAGGATHLRLDPFDARAGRAGWTEPGDVVFVEKPTPRAMVDTTGGCVVSSPSRILRLAENAPVGAHVLADRINRATPGTEWRTWEVPALPRAEALALDARLAESTRYRADLQSRIEALDTWIDAVITGVSAGSLALPHPTPHENR